MNTLIIFVIGGVVVFFIVLLYFLNRFCGSCSSSSPDRDDGLTTVHFEVTDGTIQPFVVKSEISVAEAQTIFSKILQIQNTLRQEQEKDRKIHEVQRLLLLAKSRNCRDDIGNLIIGVDATPVTLAGYCVNVSKKYLHFYVIKRDDFPWILHDPNDTAEFEMKNFNFALTLWQKEIIKNKQISIYTDNFALVHGQEKYGRRAAQLMNHYVHCCKVVITNRGGVAINKYKNLAHFAKYIQPVDNLSRWKINMALDFLCKMYDIDKENVRGTHFHKISTRKRAQGSTPSKPWYEPTNYYQQVLAEIDDLITSHHCVNANCPFVNSELKSSLRRHP